MKLGKIVDDFGKYIQCSQLGFVTSKYASIFRPFHALGSLLVTFRSLEVVCIFVGGVFPYSNTKPHKSSTFCD
jgi:hypothetical protein